MAGVTMDAEPYLPIRAVWIFQVRAFAVRPANGETDLISMSTGRINSELKPATVRDRRFVRDG
jgi:hypothetical protein